MRSRLLVALAVLVAVGGGGGSVWLWRIDVSKRREMSTIPYKMTPHSVVKCYNRYGALVYEDEVVDRAVEHRLIRLPCGVYYGGGCCVSDPPKDGTEDTRQWGVERTDSDKTVVIDGRSVECVLINEKKE